MPNIPTNGYGYLIYNREDATGPNKVIVLRTDLDNDEVQLTRWELFQFIEGVLTESGVGYLKDEKTGSITVLQPESPAATKRKEKLAMEFYGVQFSQLDSQGTKNIEYIISLEKKLGAIE